ncbi:MAG: PEP-CTERM sorting domain-containing protein [Tatlockia sp.]|nr:PEP-CTERM sorting domain-containing protein [Tatlockia sp.]
MADTQTTSSNTQDLNELLRQSPFGSLLDIKGADGNNLTVTDIFGNVGAPGGNNSPSGGANFDPNSPYGGNPFAGDNFWNIFAGGVNPSNISGSAPSGGGSGGSPVSSTGGGSTGDPAGFGGGSTGAPAGFGGGSTGAPAGVGGGSPNPTTGENTQDSNALISQSPFAPLLDIEKADGSKLTVDDIFGNVNLPASSSPLGNGGDPFAGDNFWNTFAGGVNPTTFSSSNIPAFGGNSPEGLPTGGSSTPVPEPSSILGLAVIGLGIAAAKFKQHGRRTAKVFNK